MLILQGLESVSCFTFLSLVKTDLLCGSGSDVQFQISLISAWHGLYITVPEFSSGFNSSCLVFLFDCFLDFSAY